jgi:hypothetical protein
MSRHLAGGAPEQRQLAQRHDRTRFAAQHTDDQVGRLHAALGHVDVRIGVEPDKRGGGVDAPLRVIAVQVEGDDDGAVRPDRGAHGFDEVAVRVVDAVHDHRPMLVEQHAVHRSRIFQPL